MAARSPLAVASKKRRTMTLFSSASDDTAASSSPGQLAYFSNGLATTAMMPPGGVWRIVRRLIHRSAWKVDSPKYIFRSLHTRTSGLAGRKLSVLRRQVGDHKMSGWGIDI